MNRTRAAILAETGAPLVVDDVELPDRLEYGQVLVRVRCSGVCGSQLNEIDAVKGPDRFLPHLLGHEGGGVVEEVGPGVRTVAPGDHVVLHWRKGAGIEAPIPRYRWRGRHCNAGWVTTFNERAVVSENRVTRIGDDVDLESAALFGCALLTAFGVVGNDAAVKAGESVVVLGAGGVGCAQIIAARMASAFPIVAADLVASKLEWAREFGATHAIDAGRDDLVAAVLEAVGPGGADVVIDNTGVVSVIEAAFDVTAARGRTILVGVPRRDERARIDTMPLHFEKRITGSHGGDADPAADVPRLERLMKAGLLAPQGLVSHRFGLDQINDAIAALRGGEVIRCMLRM